MSLIHLSRVWTGVTFHTLPLHPRTPLHPGLLSTPGNSYKHKETGGKGKAPAPPARVDLYLVS